MQIDMHYYGTYALARSAGIKQEAALRIAQAAQFVDDYTEKEDLETSDGALISYWPTGHNLTDIDNFDPLKCDKADPHRVWVPFHFLPGGVGATYKERMRCVKNSKTAQAAMKAVLQRTSEPCILELVGILAHIYADTFSHYGFVGLHCDENRVHCDDIKLDVQDEKTKQHLLEKAKRFFDKLDVQDENIKQHLTDKIKGLIDKLAGTIAEDATRGLGHASVADFPDRPYLRWSFKYENGAADPPRDNQKTFMEYCENLFRFFQDFKAMAPQFAEDAAARDFAKVQPAIAEILAYEAKSDDRCARWQDAATSGSLLFREAIPEYDDEMLNNELQSVEDFTATEIMNERVWHFVRAAELMRNMIFYELLPEQKIIG
jgi:hypothetical protein